MVVGVVVMVTRTKTVVLYTKKMLKNKRRIYQQQSTLYYKLQRLVMDKVKSLLISFLCPHI